MRTVRTTKWEMDRTLQVAREALSLLEGRKEVLETRLDPGAIEGLRNDIAALEALKSGRPAKTQEVRGLTGTKKDQARQGSEWVSAVREAVKRRTAGQGLRKAVGVGKNIPPTQESAVAGAIEGILTLAKVQPQVLRACGILDSDLDTGRSLLAALGEVHAGQMNGLVDKKNLTDTKNAIHARLEEAVEAVSTAGYLHYLTTDRALALRFRNLIPSSGAGGASKEEAPPVAVAKA